MQEEVGHFWDISVGKIEGIGAYLAPRPLISVLGVKYLHLRMEDGSDIYLTEYGLPFAKCLMPENHWADAQWMKSHGDRLPGTSAVHRLTTKEVDGQSKDIVLKWNRMGQDIPGETGAVDADNAEFNSPFMEFSLVLELRETRLNVSKRLHTHKPLAIYVPRKYVEGDRLGRRRHKIEAIRRSHNEVAIDWNRNYAVIYEWLSGVDAVEAHQEGLIDDEEVALLLQRSAEDLADRGFAVDDNKPQHVIVRPTPDGDLARSRDGRPVYGMIDFELLRRTPEGEARVRAEKRQEYLVRQAHRFEPQNDFPEGLSPVTIMGVDYVYGQVESTGGALWVVGRDPVLFDYFLPEKWRRSPRTRLSSTYEMYETVTKDNVHLVWRVSRMGHIPEADPYVRREKRILDHGYNSPFEEFSIAMELSKQGVETTYPRAIYMTGKHSSVSSSMMDDRRYESHAGLLTPEGAPILNRQHEYMTIWGYWNGPDDVLAVKDEPIYTGIDALAAYREGRLTQRQYVRVMRAARKRLASVGIEDLSLRGNHLLLSIDRDERLAVDDQSQPLVRVCNFEMFKRSANRPDAVS